jgi:glycosyltransferase involved in cell wall biosynthesis
MEYRPYYLGREWVRSGHQVTVLSSTFSHLRTRAPKIVRWFTREEIDGINYFWLKTPAYHGNGIERVVNNFAFIAQLIRFERRIGQLTQPDVVIASSTYLLDAPFVRKIANKYSAKAVYEVKDLWPMSLIELGGMSPKHPYVQLIQWAENYTYKHMDKLVCTLPGAEAHMRRHGLAEGKYIFIPNGIWVEDWNSNHHQLPVDYLDLFSQLKFESKFIVGYFGSHGVSNALDVLIDSAACMQNTPACFVLAGQGPEKERLEKRVQDQKIINVFFLNPLSRQYMPGLLKNVDVCYIGWKPNPIYQYGVSPNKLLDYMMAGKPVIHVAPFDEDIVRSSACGFSIPSNNISEITAGITQLMEMTKEERLQMGQRGQRYVLAHHNYKKLAVDYLRALQD